MNFQCPHCFRIFRTKNAINRHKKIKIFCKVKTVLCKNCNKYYLTEKSLKTHQGMYCHKSRTEIEQYVLQWLSHVPINGNLPQQHEDEIEQCEGKYILALFVALKRELCTRADKRKIIMLLLRLFRLGQLSDELMGTFLYNL